MAYALYQTIVILLDVLWWIIIIQAVMSWLIAFNVVNTRNQFVSTIWDMLYRVTEPLLRPIRNMLPQMGGLDLSPIVLLLIIFFIERVIVLYLYPAVF